jgi:hypothetical protein
MQSNRNRSFLRQPSDDEGKPLFPIATILINIIAIAVFIAAYWYVKKLNLIPDYINFAYWAMNVLVTYNIIAGSARSLVMPLLALAIAGAAYYFASQYNIYYMTQNEIIQLGVVGAIGLVVTFMLRR